MSQAHKSALALAGIKGAALAAAVAEVCQSAARALLHGDRAAFVDTAKEAEGTSRPAVAVRDTYGSAVDILKAARDGATLTPATDAPAWRQGFRAPAVPDALQGIKSRQGKPTAAEAEAAAAWGREFGQSWGAAYSLHCEAAAAAADCARGIKGIKGAAEAIKGNTTAAEACANREGANGPAVADVLLRIGAEAAAVAEALKTAEAAAVAVPQSLKPSEQSAAVAEALKTAEAAAVKAAEALKTAEAAAPLQGADTMQADGLVDVAALLDELNRMAEALQAAEAARDHAVAEAEAARRAEAAAVVRAEAAEAAAVVAQSAAAAAQAEAATIRASVKPTTARKGKGKAEAAALAA